MEPKKSCQYLIIYRMFLKYIFNQTGYKYPMLIIFFLLKTLITNFLNQPQPRGDVVLYEYNIFSLIVVH